MISGMSGTNGIRIVKDSNSKVYNIDIKKLCFEYILKKRIFLWRNIFEMLIYKNNVTFFVDNHYAHWSGINQTVIKFVYKVLQMK